jgi:hypothetical protein
MLTPAQKPRGAAKITRMMETAAGKQGVKGSFKGAEPARLPEACPVAGNVNQVPRRTL